MVWFIKTSSFLLSRSTSVVSIAINHEKNNILIKHWLSLPFYFVSSAFFLHGFNAYYDLSTAFMAKCWFTTTKKKSWNNTFWFRLRIQCTAYSQSEAEFVLNFCKSKIISFLSLHYGCLAEKIFTPVIKLATTPELHWGHFWSHIAFHFHFWICHHLYSVYRLIICRH